MCYLNVLYATGEVNRILCSVPDAQRAIREMAHRSDVLQAWVD